MKRYCLMPYRIPFSETDAMSIVHHSNHARYFERGRVELLRLVDKGYSEIVKMGFHFPLTELKVAFKKPLYFDDLITIETSISELTKTRMNFRYKIYKGIDLDKSRMQETAIDSPALVTGETLHCCINDKGRPIEMPDELFSVFQSLRIP
jgi:acyl-CoA thioester hydrolase